MFNNKKAGMPVVPRALSPIKSFKVRALLTYVNLECAIDRIKIGEDGLGFEALFVRNPTMPLLHALREVNMRHRQAADCFIVDANCSECGVINGTLSVCFDTQWRLRGHLRAAGVLEL